MHMVISVIITQQLSFKWSIATVSFTAEKFMKVLLIIKELFTHAK